MTNYIPANLVNPEIGVTNKGGEQTTQLVGYRGMCFRLLDTPSKAFLHYVVLNMHVAWSKCHTRQIK